MIIGAFYTANTPYKEELETLLLPSLSCLNLPGCIVNIVKAPNFGSWRRNVAEKPRIIYDLLQKYDELVFLDADSQVLKYPILFDNIPKEYDIALHYLSWKDYYEYKDSTVKECLSGTLFIRSNEKTLAFCEEWYNKAKETRIWEQKVMGELLEKSDLKVYELPYEYCTIASRPDGTVSPLNNNPVILHHQKSRLHKKNIKK